MTFIFQIKWKVHIVLDIEKTHPYISVVQLTLNFRIDIYQEAEVKRRRPNAGPRPTGGRHVHPNSGHVKPPSFGAKTTDSTQKISH